MEKDDTEKKRRKKNNREKVNTKTDKEKRIWEFEMKKAEKATKK